MSEINKGDVVQLKSGSPKMTVQELSNYMMSGGPENGASCVWFEGTRPMEKIFDVEVLEKV
ncbi:DUF2158 domain-containing protein [Pseudomonas sp. BN417]|uniref:YodC family protein n=1 Tax=Pseudomonas sp. BN417 TaxID=2567890 RepID=UPI002454E36F|nr:DUF2158 domain-containing protein [Pseudomonas sp. BN417]MDH4555754.1 DUF2158 domain-containing protein [Pseudomonas sp. BN417]